MAVQDNKIIHFQELIEELLGTMEQAPRYAFSKDMKIINARDFTERLDLLKRSLPDNLTKAEALLREEEVRRKQMDEEYKQKLIEARQAAEDICAKAEEQLKQAKATADRTEDQNKRLHSDAEAIAQKLTQQAQAEAQATVQQAQAEAQQILQSAQKQAQNMMMQASMQAEQLKSQEEVYLRAQVDAERIRSDATAQVGDLHQRVFNYLSDMMSSAEAYLADLSQEIHKERDELNSRR